MVKCWVSVISVKLVKYPIWGYYSGIEASILDHLAGFQFSAATILVRRAYTVIGGGSFVGAALVGF